MTNNGEIVLNVKFYSQENYLGISIYFSDNHMGPGENGETIFGWKRIDRERYFEYTCSTKIWADNSRFNAWTRVKTNVS